MALARINELRIMSNAKPAGSQPGASSTHDPDVEYDNLKKIELLEDYVAQLRSMGVASPDPSTSSHNSYYMPTDTVQPSEWADFDNVYQIHSPKIYLNNAIRDVRPVEAGHPHTNNILDYDAILV
jgi:hypothetical protein